MYFPAGMLNTVTLNSKTLEPFSKCQASVLPPKSNATTTALSNLARPDTAPLATISSFGMRLTNGFYHEVLTDPHQTPYKMC